MFNINDFEINKKGTKFIFRNAKIDKYDKLIFEYKIIDIEENQGNQGYYYNAEYDKSKKVIKIDFRINDISFTGVSIPDEILKEIDQYYNTRISEREDNIKKIINKIITGDICIDFSIVGCDYPHYQAWIDTLPLELEGKEQDIMITAIKEYGKGVINITENPCDYLYRKLEQRIVSRDKLRKDAINLKFNEETQKYHGFKNDIVTSFQLKLSDLIKLEEIDKKINKLEKELEFKNSIEVEILKMEESEDEDSAKVKMLDSETNESLIFSCRNIADFGYVVNPLYEIVEGKIGGIEVNGLWQTFDENNSGKGWHNVRELTRFEKKCIEYLKKYPPISTSLKM